MLPSLAGIHRKIKCGHVEDDENMIAFYSKVLMLAPERLEEYRAGMAPFCAAKFGDDYRLSLEAYAKCL